jgi:hypothetical protein
MKAADQTDCPGKWGPDILKSLRALSLKKTNAPLAVPTISRRSPLRGESLASVAMIPSPVNGYAACLQMIVHAIPDQL